MENIRLNFQSKKEGFTGYLFIFPSLICFIFLSVLPVILTFILSLTKWDLISGLSNIKYVGIDNYVTLFKDTVFQTSLINNLLFALMTIPVQLIIGFALAVVINKYCYAKNIFKAVYFLPYISSTVAVATVWMVLFQPSYGPINEMLKFVGIQNPPSWLVDPKWALPSLAAMNVWQSIGYDIIIFLAALQTVPAELYESADIDGANWFVKATKVTLPMITPTIFFLLITEIMASFRIFDQIAVVTQGGPGNATSVLLYFLYLQSFRYHKVGYGSAVTIVLFVIVFAITFLQWKVRNKWVQE